MITVAVISPFRFLETINKVITDHDFDCAFHSYSYDMPFSSESVPVTPSCCPDV